MEARGTCDLDQRQHPFIIESKQVFNPASAPVFPRKFVYSPTSCLTIRHRSLTHSCRTVHKRSCFPISNGSRWTASQWLDATSQIEVPVPLSFAWELWNDREHLNRWMPWIHSIKDRPELSEWCLKYNAFGQDFEFKWTAKNLQPIHHQKIHWRSVDGLPNRGTVRFYPRSPSSVGVQLTISYEVPDLLVPLAASVSPLVESILQKDLERFAVFAKEQSVKASVK
ncbi:hypothetical protein KP509_06G032800 [Ceratopteris richardii]|uniref:Coenzyme Q-binding protein COQ10 START domain-containing protein n=1 Tax=Ceratopteris richardii TaxID=49495 RepID=A0A8T2ULR7_CERRI|nr:hypothetical protein KP509_06G032800 [Ceratopteris richardii]